MQQLSTLVRRFAVAALLAVAAGAVAIVLGYGLHRRRHGRVFLSTPFSRAQLLQALAQA